MFIVFIERHLLLNKSRYSYNLQYHPYNIISNDKTQRYFSYLKKNLWLWNAMPEHTIINQWKPRRSKLSALFNSSFMYWTSIGISRVNDIPPSLFLKRYCYFLIFVKMLSSRSPRATQEITAQLRKSKINDENEVKKNLALKYATFSLSVDVLRKYSALMQNIYNWLFY